MQTATVTAGRRHRLRPGFARRPEQFLASRSWTTSSWPWSTVSTLRYRQSAL